MARWILKEEPDHYSWADLVRDGTTRWDGVHNALALRHLRSMAAGDEALFYHTGTERAAVGVVEVVSAPRPDPDDPRSSWSVDIRPVRPLRRSIGLAELKADPSLAGIDLIRLPRLSVVPVPGAVWDRILRHEGRSPPSTIRATRVGSRPAPSPRRRGTSTRRRR